MFDIDSGKLLIVAVIALIVIGPKELPRVLRQVGQAVGKMRRMAGEFQGQFMDAMKEADIADIRKELDDLSKTAALDVHFDPVRDVQSELNSALEPASSALVAQSEVASPAAGFELPATPELPELGAAEAGIAPVAEVATIATPEIGPLMEALTPPETILVDPEAEALNGTAVHLDLPVPIRRKILVKRRTSRLNVVQAEAVAQRTGEPLRVRRRTVRAKAIPFPDTVSLS